MPDPICEHGVQKRKGPICERSSLELRISEIESALRPFDAVIDQPWQSCVTTLQSVNREEAEAASRLLKGTS